ncbi:Cytosolic iron-sulfur protein assembly protein [Datura stramonium]|uniref:Cytosolic iron-sulfur protein assembly protein n=1 Tax=Datura stramonium TaxID=4076 RepID=A0ABS8W313_DATST|nr:Cytosolic iron-sulfur protein assembly protein [Datura stramonium]
MLYVYLVVNVHNEVDGPTFKLLLKKEKAYEMDVNSVQWNSGDRKLLASASDDGTVKIWELGSRLFGQKLLQT